MHKSTTASIYRSLCSTEQCESGALDGSHAVHEIMCKQEHYRGVVTVSINVMKPDETKAAELRGR